MMRKEILWGLVIILLILGGCLPFSGTGSKDVEVTHRERDVSGKMAIALGGVAAGMDEISIDQDFTTFELENNNPELFELTGNRVIPLAEGIGYVTPIVNSHRLDPIEITIPPQKLIQILVGEARGELAREATMEDESVDQVKPTSVSVTGDAVAAVIRNRIDFINETALPELFVVDEFLYEEDPPVSYYEAVIEASDGVIYQFSPVDPEDLSYDIYQAAANRSDLEEEARVAYDQAVLTAAAIFNDDTEDPTSGAFGFYSPTEEQYETLISGLESESSALPPDCGAADSNFPAFAPVQVVILSEVAPSVIKEDVPSFVFVRSKMDFETAVVLE